MDRERWTLADLPRARPIADPAPHLSGINKLAVASLVCSLFVFSGIGTLLGIIFGHTALREIAGQPQDGRGLAIAGLVIGYLTVVALFVVIAVAATHQ
jgi:hypothetical protein